MLITKNKKIFLNITEVYYSDKILNCISDADVIIYNQLLSYCSGSKIFHTIHIDLKKDLEDIFSEFRKIYRRDIRKSIKKDNFKYYVTEKPSDEEILDFSKFYNIIAKVNKLHKCSISKLKTLKQNNALSISVVKDEDDNSLAYLVNIIDGNRARGLYSASHFHKFSDSNKRNYLARASRYLKWMDIKYFKDRGYKIYDLGGVTLAKEDKKKNNIDTFKRGFGGNIVEEYNYCQANSLLGAIYKKIRYIQ